jgi:hypothetical protein
MGIPMSERCNSGVICDSHMLCAIFRKGNDNNVHFRYVPKYGPSFQKVRVNFLLLERI